MFLKRVFDFIASFLGLIILFPSFIVIALFIKLKMPGPVFFIQKRVGQHGKLFSMVKFRTMSVGHGGNSISVKGESRITPLGAILRKYKLDELPELYNVLKGDMSFVGPRPDVPGYADKLQGDMRRTLSLKPGITGPASMKYAREEEILAQQSDPVKYNNEVIYPDKVRINMTYLEHRSFCMDMMIIAYTLSGKAPKRKWVE